MKDFCRYRLQLKKRFVFGKPVLKYYLDNNSRIKKVNIHIHKSEILGFFMTPLTELKIVRADSLIHFKPEIR